MGICVHQTQVKCYIKKNIWEGSIQLELIPQLFRSIFLSPTYKRRSAELTDANNVKMFQKDMTVLARQKMNVEKKKRRIVSLLSTKRKYEAYSNKLVTARLHCLRLKKTFPGDLTESNKGAQ